MIKTIDTENITEEMFEAYRNTQHLADDGFTAAQIFAVLAAAPEVECEPVAVWKNKKPTAEGAYYVKGFDNNDTVALVEVKFSALYEGLMCNLHEKNSENDLEGWFFLNDLDEYFEWLGPLHTPPPASDLVERIRALNVGNVLDFGDYRHNAVIDRIVALIEGAR